MPDRDKPAVATVPAPATPAAPGTPPIPPKRSPGHRGADVKDTVAEMAAKAHEISLEAGSKMAAAMKDVIGAAAGLTGLVLESARDLLQYMVRRGQMTQDEADKLMREVEASHAKRKPASVATPSASKPATRPETGHAAPSRPVATPARPAVKHAAPAKKPAAKKHSMKPAAKKHTAKAASRSKHKASAKTAKRR
ncbi:MAG: hypothetical protein ABR585_06915 [Gemmatimonadaceae bacterium]